MSKVVSALADKEAPGTVAVKDMGLQGMITIRGDLSGKALAQVCKKITGADLPGPGKAIVEGQYGLCWMSPDEVLMLVPYGDARNAVAKIDGAMAGRHYLAVNVSDARALIRVEGPFTREVMAKLAPVDLHPDAFGVGDFRRSRLGQVAAAFWLVEEEVFQVICFRSVAEYAFDLLSASATAGPVGHF